MNMTHEAVQVDSVERLATMAASEVDELPYGFLILDRDGKILLYNRYESKMSRLSPDRVLGRNWFREVAPCTRVEAFFGRFERLIREPDRVEDSFAFRFHFLHGAQDVVVQLSRVPGDDGRVFMTVVRRNVEGVDVERSARAEVDEDRGALVGPTGVALPVPVIAAAALLDRVGIESARRVGRDVGRELAITAQSDAKGTGESDLVASPTLLRSGLLDVAIARAGWGRVALDFTARQTGSAIGIMVRPPVAVVGAGMRAFYEGLLEAMLSVALNERLMVKALDTQDSLAIPWSFAAVPEASAALLEGAGTLPPADLARRLGVFVDDAD